MPFAAIAVVGLLFINVRYLSGFNPSGRSLLESAATLAPPYGCGPKAVLYGLILLLFGVPIYVWQRREHAGIASATSTS